METIKQLCLKYTNLTDEDIQIIENTSTTLQSIANLEDADIFIDCPGKDGDAAIVVAEAKPADVPSSYKKTVVGLLAKQENEPAVARTLRLGVATKQMKAITQENGNTIQSVEPIWNGKAVIGVLIQEKRVDEQRQVSERIHFSEQSFEKIANILAHMVSENNWLTECIDEALVMVSREGLVTFRNSLARDLYRQLGYIEDVLGQPYENVRLIAPEQGEAEIGGYSYVETTVGRRVLNIKRIELATPDVAFAIVIRDLTWRREQEKALILKSVAIKEMHHRVKNNLQTIASLLRLQMRRTDSDETRQVLGESMNRILSIASTHELLAQSGVDEVMLGEVILNIKNNTMRYFANPHYHVSITLEGDDFKVDSDIATSVALIINELLQNSLKYAFQDGEVGQVRIVVTQGELYSRIKVIDNGGGFDVDNTKQNRLGLSIVQTLVKDKLRGVLDIESGPMGTCATFDFKNQIMETADVT
ncbi:MAG: sensor histidine kinase [Pseudoflavonifractor sp.]